MRVPLPSRVWRIAVRARLVRLDYDGLVISDWIVGAVLLLSHIVMLWWGHYLGVAESCGVAR